MRSPAAAAPALRPSKYLRNSQLGAVSVSDDGTEVGVALGRSLRLDATHQVRRRGAGAWGWRLGVGGAARAAAAGAGQGRMWRRGGRLLDRGLRGVGHRRTLAGAAAFPHPPPPARPQVVGRVHLGADALEAFNDIGTTPDDAPLQRIRITKCAPCTWGPPM
jgi:hypothetical protein